MLLGPVAWSLEQGPENARATAPELFDAELNSIKFAQGKDHTCVKVKLGGSEVLLWKPDEVIDDSSLMQLDVDLGFEGMKEEIGNLEKCGAGKVIGQAEVDALKKKHPLMRVIPSRWVSAYKSETRVRVRIVAKDLNKGISARKLGISSPTPSIEGLHFVFTLAAQRALRLKGFDVSHAFMHSPLPHGLVIVLKLPLSVSMPDGSQAYLLLYKALYGLRDASLHWLNLLRDARHVEVCTSLFFQLLGWKLSEDKLYSSLCDLLGVELNLTRSPSGIANIYNTSARREELQTIIQHVLQEDKLAKADAECFRGRLQFARNYRFGKEGSGTVSKKSICISTGASHASPPNCEELSSPWHS